VVSISLPSGSLTHTFVILTITLYWNHPISCEYAATVVVYFYFLYHNKQTSTKIQWAFKVIIFSQQGGIYIYKIKSNNILEIRYGDVWLRRMLEQVRLAMLAMEMSIG